MERCELHVGAPLPVAFFNRDTVAVASELLGAVLVSETPQGVTAGRVVEVEAYLGADDAGSHAATRGITERNRVMYGPPGCAYVYFTYGMYHMLNLVTEPEGVAGAVLIRALEPLAGVALMEQRRQRFTGLCDGPGKLSQALGVNLSDNGVALGCGTLSMHEGEHAAQIGSSGRIGLSGGHEAQLRFFLIGNPFVSKGRTGPRTRARRGHERT